MNLVMQERREKGFTVMERNAGGSVKRVGDESYNE